MRFRNAVLSSGLCLGLCLVASRAAFAQERDPQEATAAPLVRNVAVLLYPGVELLDFAGPTEVFSAARAADGRRFRVYTVAETTEPLLSQGVVRIVPEYSFADCPRPDLIVVPGGGVPLSRSAVVDWVRETGREAEVALSVCNGALLFAKAGLLEGLEATSHRSALEMLSYISPTTTLRPELRFVDNGRVVTSAGVSAGIDGSLHVVERLLGADAAQRTANYMEYRWDPAGAAEYHRRVIAADGPPPGSGLVHKALADGVEAALAFWKEMPEAPSQMDVNRAGYALLQTAERPADALRVFALNAAAFPESANAWDSLADAHEALGHTDEVIESTRRCLALLDDDDTLDPDFRERVRQSALERLERLTSESAAVGSIAPDFALADVAGAEHRLSDLRGRPVVLEWTSETCPSTEAYYASGRIPALRARFAGRVTWLAVNSAAGCDDRVDAIRAWADDQGVTEGYLLDPSGSAGRAFGATATPHAFVVDAQGILAYAGAVDGRGPGGGGAEGGDYLLDAIEAVLAGASVPHPTTSPVGCAIRYADRAQRGAGEWMCPPCPVDCHERVYARSGTCAECGMTLIAKAEYERRLGVDVPEPGSPRAAGAAEAIAALVRDLEQGRLRPGGLLADAASAERMRDPFVRHELKRWLRAHPAAGELALVSDAEPGERLLVRARVVDPESGEPLAGETVYFYQTDAAGIYASGATGDPENPRLFGYVRADARGEVLLSTVLPGGYPETQIPRHVHYEIQAAGRELARAEIRFADDPRLSANERRESRERGWPVVTPTPAAGGGRECTVVLSAGSRTERE